MTKTTTYCDKCKNEIVKEDYDFSKTIKVHFGHYDSSGKSLMFCPSCFEELRLIRWTVPKPPEQETTDEDRCIALLQKVLEIIAPPTTPWPSATGGDSIL
jgi:hypothetical protein